MWKLGLRPGAIPALEIFVSNFRYCVFVRSVGSYAKCVQGEILWHCDTVEIRTEAAQFFLWENCLEFSVLCLCT